MVAKVESFVVINYKVDCMFHPYFIVFFCMFHCIFYENTTIDHWNSTELMLIDLCTDFRIRCSRSWWVNKNGFVQLRFWKLYLKNEKTWRIFFQKWWAHIFNVSLVLLNGCAERCGASLERSRESTSIRPNLNLSVSLFYMHWRDWSN